MVHNLFVVRTPLQLLTAYIITHQIEPAHNELVLINPRGEKLWHGSYCLKRIVSDNGVWKRVMVFQHRLARRSRFFHIKHDLQLLRRNLLQYGRFDQIYLGSDREFDNQLLVELVGNTSYVRIEDGVWSYSSPKLPFYTRIATYLWCQLVRYVTGLNSNMLYNFTGGGYGKACTADFLYKPKLLKRYSPQPVEIRQEAVYGAMEKLIDGMQPIDVLQSGPCLIFLGSSFINIQNRTDLNREVELLQNVHQLCSAHQLNFIYKSHPFEGQEKLAYYKDHLPAMHIVTTPEPIEALFYKYDSIKICLAHSSSGLLFSDIFARQPIILVALSRLYLKNYTNHAVDSIMSEAGVHMPQDIAELEFYFELLLRHGDKKNELDR